MWRILRWVLLAVVLLIAVIVALPFFLPASVYKEQIIEQARLATGRELAIEGDLSISIWPALGVKVEKVRFSNAPGAAEPELATMDTLVVGAELFPLLSGDLRVTEIRLVNPVIHLEIDEQGRGNWLFEPQTTAEAAPADEGPSEPAPQTQTASGDFSFRDVTLSGGVLTYRDRRDGTNQRVEAINANVTLPSLDQPLAFDGGLTWNKEAITVDATIANPRALSTGGKSALTANVKGEVLNATFDGETDAASGAIAGKVDFSTSSARRLAAWAGVELPKVQGFGAMKLAGDLESAGGRLSFKNATVALDGMNGSGNLTLETARGRPYVKGDLTLDRLDLNPYMGGGGAGDGSGGSASSGMSKWSDAPIDLSALKMVDADFAFAVDALSAGGLRIGRSALALALANGKLRSNLKEMALYGGNGRGTITLDGSGASPHFGIDMAFNGIQAEPFLTDLAGFSRLEGTGNIVARVTGAGKSQRAWMKSLGGAADIRFVDGAIKGVNLAEVARTIQSALSGSAVGGGAKTDFAELGGSFLLKNGVAANKDLKMLNPFVRLNGAGIIDIGEQTMDYRIEPKAVSSIEGQGGKSDLAGIGIPFRIKGPWSNLSYAPDLSGAISSTLDSVLKGENPLDKLKEGGGIGGLLPAGKGQDTSQQEGADSTKSDEKKKTDEEKKDKDPLDSLKGLLGGDR